MENQAVDSAVTENATEFKKAIYTAKIHTTGGRSHGVARSSDGNLEVKLSTPGTHGTGTNPEQLLAAGWSACFESAMQSVAKEMKIRLPNETAIDAEVDLVYLEGEYSLQARLNITIPDVEREVAQVIVNGARKTCPYSKALHASIKTQYTLV